MKKTKAGDFFLDEKSKQAFLSEKGHETYEKLLIKNKVIQLMKVYMIQNI